MFLKRASCEDTGESQEKVSVFKLRVTNGKSFHPAADLLQGKFKLETTQKINQGM